MRDTQDEYVCLAQEESNVIKRNAKNFRMHTELTIHEEQVAHQSKILEFNEVKKF